MTRNASDPFDIKDALCRDLLPLRDGLRRDLLLKSLGQGRAAINDTFGPAQRFKLDLVNFAHTHIESIAYSKVQAFLSVNFCRLKVKLSG